MKHFLRQQSNSSTFQGLREPRLKPDNFPNVHKSSGLVKAQKFSRCVADCLGTRASTQLTSKFNWYEVSLVKWFNIFDFQCFGTALSTTYVIHSRLTYRILVLHTSHVCAFSSSNLLDVLNTMFTAGRLQFLAAVMKKISVNRFCQQQCYLWLSILGQQILPWAVVQNSPGKQCSVQWKSISGALTGK